MSGGGGPEEAVLIVWNIGIPTQTVLCNVATHSCYVAIRIDLVDLDLPVSTCTWNVEHVQQCRSTRSSSRSNDADDYLRRSIIGIILF